MASPTLSPLASGRLTGSLFLAAFVLYGVGSALAPGALGSALILANSLGVVVIGVLCARALRPTDPATARIYLAARSLEAVLLAVGLWLGATGRAGDDIAYAAAMVALAAGSVPFCRAVAHRWIPSWFAVWGVAGYVLMAVGAVADLLVPGPGVYLAVPGGLFEMAFGILLIVRGFPRATPVHGRRESVRHAGSEVA
jgi:hypothetical protein